MVPELRLIAAADIVPGKLREFCAVHNINKTYDAAEALIADSEIELVIIATPPVTHELLAIAALDAGKYVFCEKPLAHSLASAVRIAEAEARHPGRLTVGYQSRYDPEVQRLLWLCRNDWIGEVQSCFLQQHSYIPHPEYGRKGWWGRWEVAGGGVVITQLIHYLDLLLLVIGRATSVSALVDTRFADIDSEDYVEATIGFGGGFTARCIASVNSGYSGYGFLINGARGNVSLPWALSLDHPTRFARALRDVNRALPDTYNSVHGLLSDRIWGAAGRLGANRSPHVRMYRDIVRSIHSDAPFSISPSEALGSLELCMAIYESGITGKEIGLPVDESSVVYSGISRATYEKRKHVRRGPGVISKDYLSFLPTGPGQIRTGSAVAVRPLARSVLSFVGIQPATVKALLRKPAPVHGGPRVRRWPWPRRRHFDYQERRAVLKLVNREIHNGGAVIYGGAEKKAYCEAFARYLGGGYADAVNSGTNALYVALRALDLEPGSEVIVPPVTDPGGMMPVPLTMCIPVPADSHPGSILTSAEQIKAVLTDRTSAIVVAHMGGHPVDMDAVLELAAERQIPVLEDCAQAHGAVYKGRMVGTLGTISAFSTMFGKHHSTGGQGGVVFTRDPLLLAKARQVGDRGKPFGIPNNDGNLLASLNFNQTEINMAIGRVQLDKLPASIKARRDFASRVAIGLQEIDGISLIGDPPNCLSSFWYLMIRLDSAKFGCDSAAFASALSYEGIGGVAAGYSVYPTDQRWYRDAEVFGNSGLPWSLNQEQPRPFELPNAREANRTTVCVEVHESLRFRHADDLVRAIGKVARHYMATM
jgi:dTDP-4-amino-4,6-dideoxygalactose transaminase/predicted dehydrogenase